MDANTLYWDKYEIKHKPLRECSTEHIAALVDELEEEMNLRLWEELPAFEPEPISAAERRLRWRLAFMPEWSRPIARWLHRRGVRV